MTAQRRPQTLYLTQNDDEQPTFGPVRDSAGALVQIDPAQGWTASLVLKDSAAAADTTPISGTITGSAGAGWTVTFTVGAALTATAAMTWHHAYVRGPTASPKRRTISLGPCVIEPA